MASVVTICTVLLGISAAGFPAQGALLGTSPGRAVQRGDPSAADGGTEGFAAHKTDDDSKAVSRRFPPNSLIVALVFAIATIAVLLYLGELFIIGWVVDFLSEIGVPKIQVRPVPLEYEQIGEIVVVKLHDNIATVAQCYSVQKQLKHLIDQQHCDFVLDFASAQRVSMRLRGVILHFNKAARKEAGKLGKPYRPLELPSGAVFKVFQDRRRAVEEMSKHEGHGWVVLCSVPVGIRAVSA
jgi:hypothetical protein